MTPFLLFLVVAGFVIGLFWKPSEPSSAPSPSLGPSAPSPSVSSLGPSVPSPSTAPFPAPMRPAPSEASFPFEEPPKVLIPPTPSPPIQPPLQDWDLLHVASKQKSRLSAEQIKHLTSQTVLDLSILPDMQVEELDELTEDYDMEDKFRYKDVLFYKTNMEDVGKPKDDATQRAEALVAKVMEDPEWEPVLQKTGTNTFEVNELRPRRRATLPPEM